MTAGFLVIEATITTGRMPLRTSPSRVSPAASLLPGFSRGIRLLNSAHNKLSNELTRGIPLVGRVAAGEPILAEECIEDYYQLDQALFTPKADYLLRVHGMSMKDIGILDGDLLAVHKTPQADSGQIVVARVEGEVTVKRLRIHTEQGQKHISLLPENSHFSPIIVAPDSTDFCIEGIAVGSIRAGYAGHQQSRCNKTR